MNWDSIEEIAEDLESHYHDEDVSELTLEELEEMVLSLSDFEDHENKVTKERLQDILEAWIALRDGEDEL